MKRAVLLVTAAAAPPALEGRRLWRPRFVTCVGAGAHGFLTVRPASGFVRDDRRVSGAFAEVLA